MKHAAIGVRMHSGWGALVAVSHASRTVEVIDRRRIALTASAADGVKQPYHFASRLDPQKAEEFLANCFAAATRLAVAALQDTVGELQGRQFHIVGAAVLLASRRALPELSQILDSHALIHAAEGEFFREAFSKACKNIGISVSGFRERDLAACVRTAYGEAATQISQQVSGLGRFLGPPWTQDQKMAALAALLILADKPS